MIEIEMTVPEYGTRIEEFGRNALSVAHQRAGLAALRWLHDERLPKRFDGTMEGALGWKPRDPKYQRAKAKWKHRTAFHNWAGTTKARFRDRSILTVKKNLLRCRIEGLGVQYSGAGRRRWMRTELRRITGAELKGMSEIYGKVFVETLKRDPSVRKRRIVAGWIGQLGGGASGRIGPRHLGV